MYKMRSKALTATVILFVAAFLPVQKAAFAQAALSPDLALQFVCADTERSRLEDAAVEFLHDKDFQVLNVGRVQRDHGVNVLDVDISALDKNERAIQIMSLPPSQGTFDLLFTSKPPTNRDRNFESALIDFVSSTMKCDLRHITRYQNGADKTDFFESYEVARFHTLWQEAEDLKLKEEKSPR